MVLQNCTWRLKLVTSINNLSEEILKELQRYSNVVDESIQAAKDESSKQLVEDLKATSPVRTGSYAKGWRIKKSKKRNIVHNKTDYQLTHLLEKGYAKRSGGRVAAQVHIEPAERRAIDTYLEMIGRAIQGD